MSRSLRSVLTVLFLLPASALAADGQDRRDAAHPNTVTIAKVDAGKGAIAIKYTDDTGKVQEKILP
jgi:hypothetical protein